MLRRSAVVAASAVLPVVLALSACSGSSGGSSGGAAASTAASGSGASASAPPQGPGEGSNVGLSNTQVHAALDAAVKDATAVLVKGSVTDSGATVSMDLQLNKGSASGTLDVSGTDISFISVGSTTYLLFTAGVLNLAGVSANSPQGKALLNKWVSSTSSLGSGIASSFTGFTSLDSFLSGSVEGASDTFTAAGTAVVNGRTVAAYTEKDTDGTTNTLDLPVSGPALPIQSVGGSTEAGTITFDWNAPTKVSAPPASQIYSG